MAAGARQAWGYPAAAVVVGMAEGAHPVPDERSLAAGESLLALASRLQTPAFRDDPVLLLVSGGASALAEALVPGCTLADLQAMTRAALADGADIVRLNAARRTLSRLKGGTLVRALGAHRVTALTLSDVPGDDPRLIGSGLACGDTPDARPARLTCVGCLEDALDAVAAAALAEGVELQRLPGRFAGPAETVAQTFVARLTPGSAWLWGGESTVHLPTEPGRGGRNQHLALVAAMQLAGREGVALLSAGTDGVDGVTDDAGAIVDGGTTRRGEDGSGATAAQALQAADSGGFLEAAGDLVHTGPTGTNVGDILVACWTAP